MRSAPAAFGALCVVCEAVLLAWDRSSAYFGIGAFAYGLVLWLITRASIRIDLDLEKSALITRATGWRLALRLLVVAAALGLVVFGRNWLWNSPVNVAIQHFSATVGLGYGDTAIPNFLFYFLVPCALLLLLGAKPVELGLTAWRKGGWVALLGALVLPTIFAIVWFVRGRGTLAILLFLLLRNFLSNGFSEEFLMRGMTLSHLRALMSKEWAVAIQAVLFGLFHLNLFQKPESWPLECARVIAMNAPIGYFLALVALRARSVLLPGIIHATLDTMGNFIGTVSG